MRKCELSRQNDSEVRANEVTSRRLRVTLSPPILNCRSNNVSQEYPSQANRSNYKPPEPTPLRSKPQESSHATY
jgi:hypothetical protein